MQESKKLWGERNQMLLEPRSLSLSTEESTGFQWNLDTISDGLIQDLCSAPVSANRGGCRDGWVGAGG